MSCIGLASSQLGIMSSLAVVDASTDRGQFILLANPETLQVSKEMNEILKLAPIFQACRQKFQDQEK